ncbi:MAG: ExbD/TolR family protein [Acidiferrobacterales bacterium]|nr:biopolymer transporter ExbD [Gammaproteobacteria bacterium]
MKFRAPRSDEPELNLVPLIDVLLMTLIFLVVTTSFSREAHLRITLPEASVQKTFKSKTLRVSIDARGHYYINDKQLLKSDPNVLRNAMLLAAGGKKDPVVIVAADAKTPHAAVIQVLDTARRLGYTRITFATQQPQARRSSP